MSNLRDNFATFEFSNSDFANQREKLFLIYIIIDRFGLLTKPAKYHLNLDYYIYSSQEWKGLYIIRPKKLYPTQACNSCRTDANLKQIFCQIERCEQPSLLWYFDIRAAPFSILNLLCSILQGMSHLLNSTALIIMVYKQIRFFPLISKSFVQLHSEMVYLYLSMYFILIKYSRLKSVKNLILMLRNLLRKYWSFKFLNLYIIKKNEF